MRILSSIIIALTMSTSVAAQSGELVEQERLPLTPVISGPEDIAVGRTVVLDASASVGLGENTSYRWYRDNIPQPISRTVEAVYTPQKDGITLIRLEIRTTIDGEVVESQEQRAITVYTRKIALIADPSVSVDKLQIHRQTAEDEGVYLRILQPEISSVPLGIEEALVNLIKEQPAALAGAESIIIWSEGITGLQALMRALEEDTDRMQAIKNQTIVLISEGGLQTLARTAKGPFSVLKPNRIIVTHKVAINPLMSSKTLEGFISELQKRDNEYLIVDSSSAGLRPWNLLASLVNYMLINGVSSQTVILLLMLPVIAMILAFLKQVIGITTFGLYTPSIVALSFLALGWPIGLTFLLFILTTGYATRAFMRRWRMLYIPKVAIIITVVSITLLLLLGLGTLFNITFSRDTIFVLLIMSTLAESFLNVKTEEGLYSAVLGTSETILAAMLCVFIVQWAWLQSIILAYPELILLTIVVDVFLGRWSGLRLVEYFRFREVFQHLQEE
ncbi:MAG: hypothetical protein O2904_02260 [bacterium]|nr:hypothetical protein [bacterium]